MAGPRSRTTDMDAETSLPPADEAPSAAGVPLPDDGPHEEAPPLPTLAEAFTMLCQALTPHVEDNMVALVHLEEIQGWHANGNLGPSWRDLIALLEQVLGIPIRGA